METINTFFANNATLFLYTAGVIICTVIVYRLFAGEFFTNGKLNGLTYHKRTMKLHQGKFSRRTLRTKKELFENLQQFFQSKHVGKVSPVYTHGNKENK